MPFQSQVNTQQAIGFEGDWASANPRYSAIAGPGGFVSGASGVFIGRFVWGLPPVDQDGGNTVVTNQASGNIGGLSAAPIGFVHRDQQGLNTVFLSEAGMTIPQGIMVTVMSSGEFLMKNNGTTEAIPGQKAFASLLDGSVAFAASGSPPGSASATGVIAAQTFSVTGSIADDIMTVTAVGSGTVEPGATISGTGITTGNQVVGQLLPLLAGETAGGVGRYYVTFPEQNVATGTTISGTYGTLTISGAVTGAFAVGQALSGSGVVAGTRITGLGTGTGGDGTYFVNNNTAVSSTTITGAEYVETKWFAVSAGIAGQLIKTSPISQGF